MSGLLTDPWKPSGGALLPVGSYLAAGATRIQSGRPTLESGVPVSATDQTAKTRVFYTPINGDRLWLYNGTTWIPVAFSETSIDTTDTASTNAIYNSGSPTLSNLSDTSKLVRGMTIASSKSGIGALTIASIDSAAQVTMSGNATASQTGATITFKCPASKNYDLFGVLVNGSLALRFSNSWTSDTARADAVSYVNGFRVNSSVINSGDSNSIAANRGLLLGSIAITSTAGQVEDSLLRRFVAAEYNRSARLQEYLSGNDFHTYATSTRRDYNNDAATYSVKFITPDSSGSIVAGVDNFCSTASASAPGRIGVQFAGVNVQNASEQHISHTTNTTVSATGIIGWTTPGRKTVTAYEWAVGGTSTTYNYLAIAARILM